MRRHYHIYECQNCILTFAVETSWEDQESVVCPICRDDEDMADIGQGLMFEGTGKGRDDEE